MAEPEMDMADLLIACLNEVLLDPPANLPIPQDVCRVAGTEVAEDVDPIIGSDRCCQGMAWVRIGDAYPSSNFPEPDQFGNKCWPVAWGQRYEVGILGCYPTGEHMLNCSQMNTMAEQDAARIQYLKRVACCFGDTLNASPRLRQRLWVVESIQVQGPRGGCISRVMSVIVQLPKCC
jgi:hypothetical protein